MALSTLLDSCVPFCEQEINDLRMMRRYADLFPDILERTNETAHFTASAWVVNPAHSQVLMVYHNIYNSWSWPGGHADGCEDLPSVALREVREETGLERMRILRAPFSAEILTVNPHFKHGRFVVAHLHLNLTWLIEADDTQPLKMCEEENSAVKWFPIADAAAVSSEPDMRVIYRKLNAKLGVRCSE